MSDAPLRDEEVLRVVADIFFLDRHYPGFAAIMNEFMKRMIANREAGRPSLSGTALEGVSPEEMVDAILEKLNNAAG